MNYTVDVVFWTISHFWQMRKHKRESGISRSGPATVRRSSCSKMSLGKPGKASRNEESKPGELSVKESPLGKLDFQNKSCFQKPANDGEGIGTYCPFDRLPSIGAGFFHANIPLRRWNSGSWWNCPEKFWYYRNLCFSHVVKGGYIHGWTEIPGTGKTADR